MSHEEKENYQEECSQTRKTNISGPRDTPLGIIED